MNAYILLRTNPHYRHNSFINGFKHLGYNVHTVYKNQPIYESDVIVIWNRYSNYHKLACKFEQANAHVIIAENGFIGKDSNGCQYYSIAKSRHNGHGTWYVGQDDRFNQLGIEIKPWRTDGDHILVCPQRGIGLPPVAMPNDWTKNILNKLKRITKRPIRLREHPGTLREKQRSLQSDLENCWAIVIWCSSAGVEGILSGIPVFYTAAHWIMEDAASNNLSLLNNPLLVDRNLAIQRMSWAQWNISEIELGIPFQHLCM